MKRTDPDVVIRSCSAYVSALGPAWGFGARAMQAGQEREAGIPWKKGPVLSQHTVPEPP